MKKNPHFYICIPLLIFFSLPPLTAIAAESPRVAAIMIEGENSEGASFWKEVWEGVSSAAEENNILLSEYPYSHVSSENVTDLLNTAIFAQVDGIIIRVQDIPSENLIASLSAAREQGIRIITIDVDAPVKDLFCGIDNAAAGALLAEEVTDLLSPDERIVVIKSNANLSTVDDRITAFLNTLDREDAEIKYDIYTYANPSVTAAEAVEKYLEDNPDIRVIFTGGPAPLQVSMVAIARMDDNREFTLLGFYENESFLEKIGTGFDLRLIKQDPYAMGRLAVQSMAALLSGKPVQQDTCFLPITLLSGDDIQ